jgi:hypothetical protein
VKKIADFARYVREGVTENIPAFAGCVREGVAENIPAFAGCVQEEEEGNIPAFAGYMRCSSIGLAIVWGRGRVTGLVEFCSL